MVQGIWSVSLSASQNHHQSIEKTLFADGGSGIVFMLDGDAQVDGIRLPHGVIMLPVNTRADRLLMRPGAVLAGIRFQPAMGYRLLARHYHQLTRLDEKDDQQWSLYSLHTALQHGSNNQQRIDHLYHWANQHCLLNQPADSVEQLLLLINNDSLLTELQNHIALSQRQLERLFKTRLGMTAKNYQRIIRIRQAIAAIKAEPGRSLADIALSSGFSDQAHMTREFKAIARITPGKLSS